MVSLLHVVVFFQLFDIVLELNRAELEKCIETVNKLRAENEHLRESLKFIQVCFPFFIAT